MAFTGTLACLTSLQVSAGPKDGTLDFYWIDSEGGGSTLIVTPEGESVLIDTGNPGVRDSGRIHRVAKDVAHLERIDHVVVTHLHVDHFGGLAELAALMPVGTLWDNGVTDADPDGRNPSTWPLTSKPYREAKVGERRVVEPGLVLPLKTGATPLSMQCVMTRQTPWNAAEKFRRPSSRNEPPPEKEKDTSDNANSSGWLLSFGSFRFYAGGDMTWNTENKLIWPQILVPEVDVYQVVHHGLDVSNNRLLVRALNPTVSVMNNGATKGTMAEVMATLRSPPELKAQFQVHKNLRPDGSTNNCPDECIANLAGECAGHYIRCTVSSGGGKYTVTARPGAAGRTFETRPRADRDRADARPVGNRRK